MNTPIKCLLLDDELPGLAYLKIICGELEDLEVVKAFNNPGAFIAEMPALDFDLCIMDIEMPGMNGLDVAALLKGKQVIFTTAYKEYASEAFDLDAADYVRKPIEKDRLKQAVEKVKKRLENSPVHDPFITLNTDKGKSVLYINQLCYIRSSEIDSRDKTVVMDNGTTLTLKNISFEKLLEMLPQNMFCRVNKREIIALWKVRSYTTDEIVTSLNTASGEAIKIPLSESYRASFIRWLNNR